MVFLEDVLQFLVLLFYRKYSTVHLLRITFYFLSSLLESNKIQGLHSDFWRGLDGLGGDRCRCKKKGAGGLFRAGT